MFVKHAFFTLIALSASPCFADEFGSALFNCSPASTDRIGIPEETPFLVIGTADQNGRHLIEIGALQILEGERRIFSEANLPNGAPGDGSYSFDGTTTQGESIMVTVERDPSDGSMGLLSPTYTAKSSVGMGQSETWTCRSPLDPQ